MSARFLRIAVVWFVICVALGAYMGASHQRIDKELHVHGNLLGWVCCALFALVHRAWPQLQLSRLAGVHFWLHNLGLLLLALGLMMMPRGIEAAGPVLGVGSVLLVTAALAFAVMVWRTTRARQVPGAEVTGAGEPGIESPQPMFRRVRAL